MRPQDYLPTRVVEVAVHGLDIADALDTEPWLTPAAERVVFSVLIDLLGCEPSKTLEWTALDLIERGTGRKLLSADERRQLGTLSAAFPLLH